MTHASSGLMVVIGGCNLTTVHSDIWIIDTANNADTSLLGHLPHGLHSHSACLIGPDLILITGGLTERGHPSRDVYVVDVRNRIVRQVESSLAHRFSHTSHHLLRKGDEGGGDVATVALIGGVSSAVTQPEMCVIRIDTALDKVMRSSEVGLEGCDEEKVLLFNHDSYVDDSTGEVVVLGGGGNCFSFGMNINRVQLRISLLKLMETLI